MAGLAVSALVLVAVGVGVLRLAPQSPTAPAVQLQEPALSVMLADTAPQKPLAKALPAPQTRSAQAPKLQMAESSALQESAQVEIAAMPPSDTPDTAIATALEEEMPVPATQVEEVEAAIKRLQTGEYGSCLMCGDQIEKRRLILDPAIPTCLICAKNLST